MTEPRRIQSAVWLPAPPEQVFEFFCSPRSLLRVIPRWLRLRLVEPVPDRIAAGTEIRYAFGWNGLRFSWRAQICLWEPPHRFADRQLEGPFRYWLHEHRFVNQKAGTLYVGDIRYACWGGWLVATLLVGPALRPMLAFRARRLQQVFSGRWWAAGDSNPEPAD